MDIDADLQSQLDNCNISSGDGFRINFTNSFARSNLLSWICTRIIGPLLWQFSPDLQWNMWLVALQQQFREWLPYTSLVIEQNIDAAAAPYFLVHIITTLVIGLYVLDFSECILPKQLRHGQGF